jgi:hypothetical protein
MVKTLKIEEETHRELTKFKGTLLTKLGKDVTYDETIMELLKIAKQHS